MTYEDLFKEFIRVTGLDYGAFEDYRPCSALFGSRFREDSIVVWLKESDFKLEYTHPSMTEDYIVAINGWVMDARKIARVLPILVSNIRGIEYILESAYKFDLNELDVMKSIIVYGGEVHFICAKGITGSPDVKFAGFKVGEKDSRIVDLHIPIDGSTKEIKQGIVDTSKLF